MRALLCALRSRKARESCASLLLVVLVLAHAGCSTEILGTLPDNATDSRWNGTGGGGSGVMPAGGSGATPGAGAAGGNGTPPAQSDLPCAVASMLAMHCVACHDAEPPGRLTGYADLLGPSDADAGRSVAEEALARLQSSGRDRMPPAPMPPPSEAQIAAFQAWLSRGTPPESCGDGIVVAPDPYDTPVVCTSQQYWTGGDRESPSMHPGGACIACHTREDEGPTLAVAGTLYATPHEPTDCNGVSATAGAEVVIVDANGSEHRLRPNAAGNFFLEAERFAFPYTAKVTFAGRERIMVEPQGDGDCNGCHTEAGASLAPGRIFVP